MENIRTRPLSALEGPAWRRYLPQALVFSYLLVALAAYLTALFLTLTWVRLPFIGAFVEQTLIFNGTAPSEDPSFWPAYQQGLRLSRQAGSVGYYQLLAIGDQPVRNAQEMQHALAQYRVGDEATLLVRAPDGQPARYTVRLSYFPFGEQLNFFYFPYLIGLVYLAAGIWVFAIRRHHASGRAFVLFSVSMALCIGLLFDLYTTHRFTPLWTLALALAGSSAVNLVLLFPREDPLVRRFPALPWLVTLAGLLLAAFAITRLYDFTRPFDYAFAWALEYGYLALCLVFVLVWLVYRRSRMTWPNDREQVRWIGWAAVASFGPIGAWLLATFLGLPWGFEPYLLFPLLIFPVVSGYTVHRYRLLRADLVLSKGLQYGLMTILATVGYALLAAGLGLGLSRLVAPDNPIFTGLLFFVLALLLSPLREGTQRAVDTFFFRGRRAYQDRLQTFSGELTRVVDLPGITGVLRRYVEETLAPSRLHVYVYDALSDQYIATPGPDGQPTSDLRFPIISGLAIRLSEYREPLILSGRDDLPQVLQADLPRLMLLNAQVFVPLPGRQRLSGWLALGQRQSGEPYSSLQLGFAEALCDQAALAIERAQVVANMENRVREMNALTRVAQGINITLKLDDILELVYAQTTQIIPAQHFQIMLYNKELDVYQYAFFLENDDRLTYRENRPVPAGQALEQEVIRQRRAILAEDFHQECQRRGIVANRPDLYAWLGVPLNAGAETIGALSLGSSAPAVEYTPEQQALLQAIADLAAGALVKARLLDETERRARQLSSLNEVTRQLTSTLETEPLLQSILQSAVDILNCEAGSLLMMDHQAGELVFKVTTGPVAGDLVNQRMPADRGVVGQAVKTCQPVIVNDVLKSSDWFKKPDEDTGFVTRALLAIPLLIKDRVLGVIEVINKKDGTLFSNDDQELLAAFASQAVVAIENARLYTHTDQALAARVEELSVMQRIDRELNASLDTSRAMRITLEWAMRQSAAVAGLVAVLRDEDPSGVRVMASQGYTREIEPYENEPLPIAEYGLQDAIQNGQSVRRLLDGDGAPRALLAGCRSQAILPIRRETRTIGLLLLESTQAEPLSDETMSFLSRLTDHASIAISNAQLYNAVQQANLAKSDFISFVAHELKNPMTSVKGYTELIAAGAVGPITDAQANFLATIRHNIERMNTLVSDLNDMSKIEVGRLRLDFKSISLKDVIDGVVRSTRKQIEEKQQTLTLNLPGDLPPVWADRTRVEQVLVNIVSNAHKYTPAGGTLELGAEACDNRWGPGAARVVHLWVQDNGIGISEEDQKKIFQKFFRSDDPKTREVTGTGLGLNITRSLVEMQGGQIWFESVFRQGTTFHFTIPVSESEA